MREGHRLEWFVVAGMLAALGAGPAYAQVRIRPSAVVRGATSASGPTASLKGSAGQVAAGRATSPTHIGDAGFWPQVKGSSTVGVGDEDRLPARSLWLAPPRPNPFSASTRLAFALPRAAHVRLQVFDLEGRRVATLRDAWTEAGDHVVSFAPQGLKSGIYVVLLEASGHRSTRRLALLR